MKRRWATVVFGALLLAAAAASRAEDKPAPVKTATAGLTAEELELARYLDLLKDFELFEDWELAELLSVLEDDEDDR